MEVDDLDVDDCHSPCGTRSQLSVIHLTSFFSWMSSSALRRALRCGKLFEARHLFAQLGVAPGDAQLCCMLDVTLLYHEETHAALVYETRKPLDAKGQVAPLESAEGYHRLVGVQNYGAGNTGIYSSDQVGGIALVGL